MSAMPKSKDADYKQRLADTFPEVDPGIAPFGSRVIVQIRKPVKRVGSIYLADATIDAETHNMKVAKVVAVGPVAFKDRQTMKPWPEGAWAQPGDFVRVPKFGGDRWEVADSSDSKVWFAMIEDTDLIGLHTGDPTTGMATL